MKHKTAFKPIVISIVLSILLITTAVFFARHHNSIPSINTDFLQQEITEPEEPSPQIVQSARNQIGKTLRYDPAYTKLTYPMGDVPMEKGVCTDVVIRALREQNIDLQELVHQDMSRNFSVYPKRWGLKQPDTNIDHRRVPNLMTYFTRQGWAVQDTNYQAGDIVTWELKGNRPLPLHHYRTFQTSRSINHETTERFTSISYLICNFALFLQSTFRGRLKP